MKETARARARESESARARNTENVFNEYTCIKIKINRDHVAKKYAKINIYYKVK